MAQQMVQDPVYSSEMTFRMPGILRLVVAVVKLPFLILKAVGASVMAGFRIFVGTAEDVGLRR